MKCISCLVGRSWECLASGNCDVRSESGNFVDFSDVSSDDSGSALVLGDIDPGIGNEGMGDVERAGRIPSQKPGTPVVEINTYKDDSVLKDQQSTGRKRAAIMYPLDEEADCEWARKKNVGGNIPIVGCIDGKQQARHHGPDKNTLNNESGNVHRICHNCHNRWHAVNDPDYVWGSIYPAHEPGTATFKELVTNMTHWSTKKISRVKD